MNVREALLLKNVIGSGGGGGGDSDLLKHILQRDVTSLDLSNVPITNLGEYVFTQFCKYDPVTWEPTIGLESIVLPKTLIEIEACCFQYAEILKEVVFQEGLEVIGDVAFQECAIEEIDLPSSIKIIGEGAFSYCDSLYTVTMRGKPMSIDSYAFEESSNLTTINVSWSEGEVSGAPWGATNATINYNYVG